MFTRFAVVRFAVLSATIIAASGASAGTLSVCATGERRVLLLESTSASAREAGEDRGDAPAREWFSCISAAVARARTIRDAGSHRPIVIDIGPGPDVDSNGNRSWHGSWDPAVVAKNPTWELLPILVDVGQLTIRGHTRLTYDDAGRPVGEEPGVIGTTIVGDNPGSADFFPGFGYAVFTVARRLGDDEGIGDDVEITGLHITAQHVNYFADGSGVYFDRVSGYYVHDNIIDTLGLQVASNGSAGAIEGNLLYGSLDQYQGFMGVWACASTDRPARLRVEGNVSYGNNHAGLALFGTPFINSISMPFTQPDWPPLDVVLPGGPEANLSVVAVGNEFANNGTAGIKLYAGADPAGAPVLPSSQIKLDIRGNLLHDNGNDPSGAYFNNGFGFTMTTYLFAGSSPHTTDLSLNVDSNRIEGNNTAPAYLGFVVEDPALTGNGYAFERHSTIRVSGTPFPFVYRNPIYDPEPNTPTCADQSTSCPLGNKLIVDGVEYTGMIY